MMEGEIADTNLAIGKRPLLFRASPEEEIVAAQKALRPPFQYPLPIPNFHRFSFLFHGFGARLLSFLRLARRIAIALLPFLTGFLSARRLKIRRADRRRAIQS
ncbi:hypothetical protein [Sphingopyxis sp.]|uniref:hypothetical protein n=1 Tax=Sphingopyxis sp. TaxID=1908224 RepID=UPI002B4A8CEC|nr:hypothetical protein [Sphingopyxis sp.]HJS09748.1 hypothetical protein [Sphingopyxis sp.]